MTTAQALKETCQKDKKDKQSKLINLHTRKVAQNITKAKHDRKPG